MGSLPTIFRRLFANDGAGPLLQEDIVPLPPVATTGTPGLVKPGKGLLIDDFGELSVKSECGPVYSRTEITTAGSFIYPAKGWYWLEALGGGGPGGRAWTASTGGYAVGGGGSSGEYKTALVWRNAVDCEQVIIGAGGRVDTDGSAVDGGATSIGSNLHANGGHQGQGPVSPTVYKWTAQGGTPAGAGSQAGGDGGHTIEVDTNNSITSLFPGYGAASPYGAGGVTTMAANVATANGSTGIGYGSGGSGGFCYENGEGVERLAIGGAGAPGIAIITFIGGSR